MPKVTKQLVQPRTGTPGALGYRMPAEWEPHAGTWIAWPHNRTDWPGKFEPIGWVMAEIVRHLAKNERVNILVNDASGEERALKFLRRAHVVSVGESKRARAESPIQFHRFPTNRIWTRDYGPIFVKKGQSVGALDFRFSAWAKYRDWQRDDLVPGQILKTFAPQRTRRKREPGGRPAAGVGGATFRGRILKSWQPEWEQDGKRVRVVLEGGSIDVNGKGTMLTTEECLLSDVQQRNPGLSRKDLEQVFANYLGITRTLWLGRGIAGDDTHGHVDDLARFVNPSTVVVVSEEDRDDENCEPLRENYNRLRRMTDQNGRPLRVVKLPMPEPVWFEGRRLPASYANFYIANGSVLVPTFNSIHDLPALNILQELFPRRRVIPIYCGDFIWGLGALHCMTQQEPAV